MAKYLVEIPSENFETDVETSGPGKKEAATVAICRLIEQGRFPDMIVEYSDYVPPTFRHNSGKYEYSYASPKDMKKQGVTGLVVHEIIITSESGSKSVNYFVETNDGSRLLYSSSYGYGILSKRNVEDLKLQKNLPVTKAKWR